MNVAVVQWIIVAMTMVTLILMVVTLRQRKRIDKLQRETNEATRKEMETHREQLETLEMQMRALTELFLEIKREQLGK